MVLRTFAIAIASICFAALTSTCGAPDEGRQINVEVSESAKPELDDLTLVRGQSLLLNAVYDRTNSKEPLRRLWMTKARLDKLRAIAKSGTADSTAQGKLYKVIFEYADRLSITKNQAFSATSRFASDPYAGPRGANICLKTVSAVGLKYLSFPPKIYSPNPSADPFQTERRKYILRANREIEWAVGAGLTAAQAELALINSGKSGSNLLLWAPRVAACLAIAYDWFYPDLTAPELSKIGSGIQSYLRIVLDQQKSIFQSPTDSRRFSNWNPAVNSFSGIAAATLLKVGQYNCDSLVWKPNHTTFNAPQSVLCQSIYSIPDFLNSTLDESGAYFEGPNYLDFAFQPLVAFGDVLSSTLGQDFGLLSNRRISSTLNFESMLISPSSSAFGGQGVAAWSYAPGIKVNNFSDADEDAVVSIPTAAFLRLSQSVGSNFRFVADKVIASYLQPQAIAQWRSDSQNEELRFMAPIFWASTATPPVAKDSNVFDSSDDRLDFVVLNSSWTKNHGSYAAIKGGYGNANHAHLDSGSVIFDAYGIRWFGDFGKDDYRLPKYFASPTRWRYLRTNNLGHSTLQIGSILMDPLKKSKLISSQINGGMRRAVVDLKPPFASVADIATREFSWQESAVDVKVSTVDKVKLKSRLSPGASVAAQFVHCWKPTNVCPIELAADKKSITVSYSFPGMQGIKGAIARYTTRGAETRFSVMSADPKGGNSASPCTSSAVVNANPSSTESSNESCAFIRAEIPESSFFSVDGSAAISKDLDVTISVRSIK